MFKTLGERDAHLLLQMCIDAEELCTRRIEELRDKGDTQGALYAVQRKEQYESLKRKIVAEIQGDQTSLMEDSIVFSERVRKIREGPPGGKQ
jgi:hypothetical protein